MVVSGWSREAGAGAGTVGEQGSGRMPSSRVVIRRRGRSRGLLAAVCLLAAPIGARGGEVWVVDDDGPANFRDLPAAVASARDGDTLVLRAGRYSAARWSGKGLVIVGAGSGATVIERRSGEGPFLAVSEVAIDSTVLLSGVTGIGRGSSLEFENINGLLVVADVVVDGRDGAAGPRFARCSSAYLARVAAIPPLRALGDAIGAGEVAGSGVALGASPAGITLQRGSYSLCQVVAIGSVGCDAKSPRGLGQEGGPGLSANDVQLELALCEFVGGRGGAALWDVTAPFCPEAATAGTGGSGVALGGRSSLRAAGSSGHSFVGGAGGSAARNPWEECYAHAGSGGAGLLLDLEPGQSIERPAELELVGGEAGAGAASRAGRSGRPIEPPQEAAGDGAALPTLALDPSPTVGGAVTLRVFGTPGDRVRLFVGAHPQRVNLKQIGGFAFHLMRGAPLAGHEFEIIGDDGQLRIEAPLPADAALVGKLLAVQALVTPRSGRGRDSVLTNIDLLVIGDGAALAMAVPPAGRAGASGSLPGSSPRRLR